MGNFYKRVIRPILFLLPAETAHRLTFFILKMPAVRSLLKTVYHFSDQRLQRELFGLTFPNPIGLAAGFDKNAEAYHQLSAVGFGFIEIGTVTPLPQPGNPQPRLFRLKADQAIINRMGFNNEGVEAVVRRLRKRDKNIIIGGNIGKNKITPNELAVQDYLQCFEALFEYVDYFVVNVSSPNTPDLRELQDKEPLLKLLSELQTANATKARPKPILLKIAPDLSNAQLDDIIDIVRQTRIAGIIATNTTISRANLATPPEAIEKIGAGGLSGKPLTKRSTEVIRYLHQKSGGQIPIIGVGGIHSVADALEKLDAGASLIQLYTGFVYEGPALIRQIKKALLQKSAGSQKAQ
jgi:dihydroorotate dehydrogenase